jgi:hypothetical protein
MGVWAFYKNVGYISSAGTTRRRESFGSIWRINSESQFLQLKDYETSAYTWCGCDIELSSGRVLSGCRTFCWAGDSDTKELEEGTFDLQRYQSYFKPSVVRKSPWRGVLDIGHQLASPHRDSIIIIIYSSVFHGSSLRKYMIRRNFVGLIRRCAGLMYSA